MDMECSPRCPASLAKRFSIYGVACEQDFKEVKKENGSVEIVCKEMVVDEGESTSKEVAIKSEFKTPLDKRLWEYQIYKCLQGASESPNVLWYTKAEKEDVVPQSLKSLLLSSPDQKFTVKTVCLLADQIISLVEGVHLMGYVNRDLKPENFVVERWKNDNQVYLVDCGFAKNFYHKKSKGVEGRFCMAGTARFASLNWHKRTEHGRCDDLETLGYIFIFLLKGRLPWDNVEDNYNELTEAAKAEKVGQIKMELPVDELCSILINPHLIKGCPEEFAEYLKYCRRLKLIETPNYAYISRLFYQVMGRFDYKNGPFDWEEEKEKVAERKKQEAAILASTNKDEDAIIAKNTDATDNDEFNFDPAALAVIEGFPMKILEVFIEAIEDEFKKLFNSTEFSFRN